MMLFSEMENNGKLSINRRKKFTATVPAEIFEAIESEYLKTEERWGRVLGLAGTLRLVDLAQLELEGWAVEALASAYRELTAMTHLRLLEQYGRGRGARDRLMPKS